MGSALRLFILPIFLLQAGFAFGQTPDFNVGVRSFAAPFQGGDDQIKMLIWYPTPQKARMTKLGPFELPVARDAEPAEGKHGLIIISHGTGGSHMGHWDTAMYMASKGFFVAAILHPHDNYADDSDARTERNWANRPKHIKAALDYILANAAVKGHIDSGRIGIIGHSAGGYTALAAVGGTPDTSAIGLHCGKHGKDDPEFCGYSGLASAFRGLLSGAGSVDKNPIPNTLDPRIKAAVLLAPAGVPFAGAGSLSAVKVPIMLFRAEKDRVLRYPFHAENIHRNLPLKHKYIMVQKAGHYSFLAPYPDAMKQRAGMLAQDPAGFHRAAFHRLLNREVAAFFSRTLQGS